ncbi:hypothetical protein H4W80_010365 [Nonomuraea angiospora]|uniref:Uncharacterized protein n=1 Tax=Nonomuraea angiospora TaxID=46172 RepID=A0ABR9MI22_9ACTN|nr:hypothetical protein [Nonomuraea angiospora]
MGRTIADMSPLSPARQRLISWNGATTSAGGER